MDTISSFSGSEFRDSTWFKTRNLCAFIWSLPGVLELNPPSNLMGLAFFGEYKYKASNAMSEIKYDHTGACFWFLGYF
jgi:hypothetical protein